MLKKKVDSLMKRIEETNGKLAEALSLVTINSIEMEAMKKHHVEEEHKFYEMGISNAKNSVTDIRRDAQLGSFTDDWVVALDALQVPLNSLL